MEQTTSFLYTQELGSIPEDFPLISSSHELINLLVICINLRYNILIDILLQDGNIMLQVNYLILVQEVVHVLIHTLDDMVTNFIILVGADLEHPLLHVLNEIPNHDLQDVPFMVVHDELQPF